MYFVVCLRLHLPNTETVFHCFINKKNKGNTKYPITDPNHQTLMK